MEHMNDYGNIIMGIYAKMMGMFWTKWKYNLMNGDLKDIVYIHIIIQQ